MNGKGTALSQRLRQWQDWIALVLGAWLFISPWLLLEVVPGTAAWNFWVVGAAIVVVALAALFRFHEWAEWVNGALGVWLVISPWVLKFSSLTAATWNAVVCGILVVALAIAGLWEIRHAQPKQA